MILGQGLGRIGDLINGEHLSTASDLPWAFVYTHPDTLGELGQSVHPTAGGYELLGDFIILAFPAVRCQGVSSRCRAGSSAPTPSSTR